MPENEIFELADMPKRVTSQDYQRMGSKLAQAAIQKVMYNANKIRPIKKAIQDHVNRGGNSDVSELNSVVTRELRKQDER